MPSRNPSWQKDDDDRSPGIPEPSGPAITSYAYNGEPVTPGAILRLYRSAAALMQASRNDILVQRAFRRGEESSRVQINPKWARLYPDAAQWVREKLEQRITLDSDMVAKAGGIEPRFARAALGFRDRDQDYAAECKAYLEEERKQRIPYQRFIGKNVEDGQFGLVVMPAFKDMDGAPDFFEMLEANAYEQLPADERKGYEKLDGDRTGRYVKLGEDGKPKRNPEFDKGDDAATEKAHSEAIQRYLLGKRAVNYRVIPALDCAPIFVRSRDRDAWECISLVERTLYSVQELEHYRYGWKGMGDRRLIPQAYNADGSSMRVLKDEQGTGGQFYVYTAYLVCETQEKRGGRIIRRPVIASCVGGTSTWNDVSGNPDDDQSVTLIDLYEETKVTKPDGTECGLEGPLWSYHFGLHGEDDDPAHYARPYGSVFRDRIRAIEGNKTAINAATHVNSFTGHYQEIDPRFAQTEGGLEAIIDGAGELRRPKVAGVGEIEATTGRIVPAQQARVGSDAWQVLAADMQSLQAATAIDQIQTGGAPSARSLVVQSAIGDVSKRQIRDGAAGAVISCGEKLLRILHAYHEKWGVRWPLQTTQQRPVGSEQRDGQAPAEFNPAWVGDGHYALTVDWPPEENLAKTDLEASLYGQRLSTLERVATALGEEDATTFRAKILRDMLWSDPATIMSAQTRLANQSGNKELQAIIRLRNQGRMGQADLPVIGPQPSVAVGNGQTQAAASRGGQKAAAMMTGPMRAEGEMAAMISGQGAA